jgi:hypothetical protein
VKTGLDAITPTKYREHVHKVAPIVVSIWTAGEASVPYLQKAKDVAEDLWQKAEPYHPKDLIPALCGLAMVFFGGDFPYLIAAVTAVRVTGTWDRMSHALADIYGEVAHVFVESRKDDAKDDDGDGIPDVQQIDPKQVVQRKVLLAAKTVDPEKLGHAVTTAGSGALAVLASLKLTFARALTLGSSLGETLSKPAVRFAEPALKGMLDEEFHKWIVPAVCYLSRFCAMSVAFWLQRMISTVHSAVQGGQLFTSAGARYLNKYGVISFDPDKSTLDEKAGYVVAALGIYVQWFIGTPILLSVLLLPFTILDWCVQTTIAMAK